MSRQIEQLMDEEIKISFEIIRTLKILVEKTQWNSNALKVKLEELLSQHDTIDFELDKIEFYDKSKWEKA